MSLVVKNGTVVSEKRLILCNIYSIMNIFTLAAEKQKVTLELPPNVKIIPT